MCGDRVVSRHYTLEGQRQKLLSRDAHVSPDDRADVRADLSRMSASGAAPELERLQLRSDPELDSGNRAHRGRATVKVRVRSEQALELWSCTRLEGRRGSGTVHIFCVGRGCKV